MYYTPGFARIARAKVLTLRNEEFVEASIALGASDRRILLTHILPNALAPIIIRFTLSTGGSILEAAALSFIGLGIQPPKAEWGLMISQGRQYLSSYWQMAIIPGLCIVFLTYILNYLGDGLRDALDPKLNN
jgi:peptide/nickel transport system permease protein